MAASWGKAGRPRTKATDPYYRWAKLTGWRGYTRLCSAQRAGVVEQIQIIAKAPSAAVLRQMLDPDGPLEHPLQVPATYKDPVRPGGPPALHFTATLPMAEAAWLERNPLRLRWRLAMPARDAELLARPSDWGLYGETRDLPDAKSLLAQALATPVPEQDEPVAQAEGLLAVIDHGCPFLNDRFVQGERTRVVALWDQGVGHERPLRPGWPWRAAGPFGRGRQLGPLAMQSILDAVRGPGRMEETAAYRGIDYLIDYNDPRRRVQLATHGGHLLDVIGGRHDPLDRAALEPDPASGASLAFVQLPFAAAMDSTGSSLAPHLLDGVRYAMSLCKPDSPLVVSISYGGQAGPHDGSSLIERALDELVRLRKHNFAIVLAAGNARQARCHARRTLRKNHSAVLRCAVSAGDTTDSHVEIWYTPPPKGQAATVKLRARSPGRLWSGWVAPGQQVQMNDLTRTEDMVALLQHMPAGAIGDDALALLSLAPTQQPEGIDAATAEPGVWEIEVMLEAQAAEPDPVVLRAWVERDDPARGSTVAPPRFADQLDGDELDTLCSIATGDNTFAAGGFNLGTGRPAPYSAPGRAPRRPDVLAACEQDTIDPNIAAAATRSGEQLRMNGTSVAAPVLARRLFNHMKRNEGTLLTHKALLTAVKRWLDDGSDPCLKAPPP